jgi:hypothetical protein
MKRQIALTLAVGTLMLAGCSSTVRTIESKDSKLTLTEQRGGGSPRKWELKEVTNPAEVSALRQAGWKREGVLHQQAGADIILMKRKLNPQAAVPPTPFQPMFITTLGTNSSPDGTWRIEASTAGDSLGVSYKNTPAESYPFTVWSSIGVPGWKAKTGWFVFLENESRVWTYDGDRQLYLEVDTPGHGSLYQTPKGFPCAVPAEVLARVSEAERKNLESESGIVSRTN